MTVVVLKFKNSEVKSIVRLKNSEVKVQWGYSSNISIKEVERIHRVRFWGFKLEYYLVTPTMQRNTTQYKEIQYKDTTRMVTIHSVTTMLFLYYLDYVCMYVYMYVCTIEYYNVCGIYV